MKLVWTRPPLTCSTSSAFSSRAPWRVNTLFWLSIRLSFPYLGPWNGPNSCKNCGPLGGGPPRKLALRRAISVTAEIGVPCAGSKGPQAPTDLFGFLAVQFASARAYQYSVVVIHAFLLFCLLHLLPRLHGPKPAKCYGKRAAPKTYVTAAAGFLN